MGAPFAVLIAEQLIASGCRHIIGYSSSGAISDRLALPCLVAPGRALRDEGTSYHYAKLENQSSCCTPGPAELPVAADNTTRCCSPPTDNETLHQRLAELLRMYNVNDYAASFRVFALKPK